MHTPTAFNFNQYYDSLIMFLAAKQFAGYKEFSAIKNWIRRGIPWKVEGGRWKQLADIRTYGRWTERGEGGRNSQINAIIITDLGNKKGSPTLRQTASLLH